MGLDLIEIVLEVEEKFGVTLAAEDFGRLFRRHQPPDIRAGDLLDLILSHPRCARCGYDLSGHPPKAICPECGTAFDLGSRDRAEAWRKLRLVLTDMSGVKPSKITEDSLFVRDLGLS